ncbi:MAG: hypothetical protein S0880_18830 [Actinomycetota bacterium]|nr:hypothetical protein [Actinomycetota bacterium]
MDELSTAAPGSDLAALIDAARVLADHVRETGDECGLRKADALQSLVDRVAAKTDDFDVRIAAGRPPLTDAEVAENQSWLAAVAARSTTLQRPT